MKSTTEETTTKKCVFVCDLSDPSEGKSSTQIITYTILDGLAAQVPNLFVIGLYSPQANTSNIESLLREKKINFSLLSSKSRIDQCKNRTALCVENFKARFGLRAKYHKDAASLPFVPELIMVCIPSFEAAYYALSLKRQFPSAKLEEIWTDVYACNFLDNPYKIPFRRRILSLIEKPLLKSGDSIFYLGEPQLSFQKQVFKKWSKKMHCYSPSYFPKESAAPHPSIKTIGYYGVMDSSYRNLSPILSAAQSFPNLSFLLKGPGHNSIASTLSNTKIILLKERESISEAFRTESSIDVSVCYINSHGFSLPGKIFYNSDIQRPILVILDGPFSQEFQTYLKTFDRFFFANNTEESIKNAIKTILSSEDKLCSDETIKRLSPQNSYRIFLKDD